jgi:hypothetical protein
MALPIIMLRKLNMKTREKIGLFVVFGLVLINVCFVILRTNFTLSTMHRKDSDQNTLWASLDPIVAVMVCTLPCYRRLFSSDRARPIIRTPNISFHSSSLKGMFRITSRDERVDTYPGTEIHEVDTDRGNGHSTDHSL